MRDYWRRDRGGRRLLTLRQIAVRVRHLPPASAVARALGGSGWSTTDYLLSDVFHAHAGTAHPARPTPDAEHAEAPDRRRARTAALARKRQREQDIAAGRIT
ncbi:hypothetical protein ACIOC1_00420 [Streptomyces sp. NPDC088197]|uniref:hypothetical protein n=1 Tax=Streptomyces sp. NPDC088197 TaxID=3365840 RepID=UPI003823678B